MTKDKYLLTKNGICYFENVEASPLLWNFLNKILKYMKRGNLETKPRNVTEPGQHQKYCTGSLLCFGVLGEVIYLRHTPVVLFWEACSSF